MFLMWTIVASLCIVSGYAKAMGLHMHPYYYIAVGARQYSVAILLFHLEQLEIENLCIHNIFRYSYYLKEIC